MAILTVRLTPDEERLLTKRSRGAGMKKATFVRQLIREEPFVTGAESRMRSGGWATRDCALPVSETLSARFFFRHRSAK
jgi:hypothetical protein